ncbi:MAG: proline racemase family protein [Actinomycetota bacterium]|nr:proline racemase family protein [Actinomycetota bacterium]
MVLGPDEMIVADDYHTAGEPFRIVNLGPMEGNTVLDRRSWAMANLDNHRRFLINEPRGHADMYGGMVVPPDKTDAGPGDVGVVFFHKDGFSTACGHGTIAMATWAIDSGRISAPEDGEVTVVVDVPSGRLPTVARMVEGRVASVRFTNVEAFVSAHELMVDTSLGPVTAHVSFGGAFYASVAVDDLPVSCRPDNVDQLITLGREVKAFLDDHPSVVHPSDDRLSGLYGTILHEDVQPPSREACLHQRNVTIFADGQVDRSPCGSGTCARMALLHHDGRLEVGDPFHHEGVAGGTFEARIEAVTDTGIIPSVEGSSHRHATTKFTLDPHDPVGLGFLFR